MLAAVTVLFALPPLVVLGEDAPATAMVCPDVCEALRLLGKRHVVLVVHDTSFPASPGEDLGHGSPYSTEARAFVAYLGELGFNGLQLGPQGQTRTGNVSPYDSTLFSRNELAISLAANGEDPLLDGFWSGAALGEVVEASLGHERRTDHAVARRAWRRLLDGVAPGLAARPHLQRAVAEFISNHRDWIVADALHDDAGDTDGAPADRVRRHAFLQMLFHRQHATWKAWLGGLGMTLWGDLQVGMAPSDAVRFRRLFLPGYRLGAPPSRTNPTGQPWGYPVLDPRSFTPTDDPETSALAFLSRRMAKMRQEYDGVRIDHPQGLICPWVYRSDRADPLAAVQQGARLFESPAVREHAELAQFSRVRLDQVNVDPTVARYADDWVVDLDEAQVDAYGVLLDVVVQATRRDGGPGLICEVLSTQPYPMRRVLERYGLGRYRVTQKADPTDERDVYRSENAQPCDWIMAGNHDTPSIWRLARAWHGTARGAAEAAYLARRLRPGGDPLPLERTLREEPGALVHAKLSDVFASRAEHVKVFFTDLLGMEETYNEPGTVGPHNWTLRVPPDWRRHGARARRGQALDLRAVLAGALQARGLASSHAGLITRLLSPAVE